MNAELKSKSVRPEASSGGVEWEGDWQADCLVVMCEASDEQQSPITPVSLPSGSAPAAAPLRRSLFRA